MIQEIAFPSAGLVHVSRYWLQTKDGDEACFQIFQRHYSYREGRKIRQFVGPGEKCVLITEGGDALWVWRKYKTDDGQTGINCAVFRNESDILSSTLILDAELVAAKRWPGQRLFTYVNPKRIRSTNPGACFKRSGWTVCGKTKWKGLVILEKQQPSPIPDAQNRP